MSFRLSSWNIEGRLASNYVGTGRGSSAQILKEIRGLDADVLVLPESYDRAVGLDPNIDTNMKDMGYTGILDVDYKDKSPNLGMRIASKLPIQEWKEIRLGEHRSMLALTVQDPDSGQSITIYGVHFDDESKAMRLRQIEEIAAIIENHLGAVAVVGDYNAMTGENAIAKFVTSRLVRAAISPLPSTVRSIRDRAIGMASGEELRKLAELTGLRNADPSGQATTTPKLKQAPSWMPAIRMADIDHLFVSKDVQVQDFSIMKRDGGSDHRAISATISAVSARE